MPVKTPPRGTEAVLAAIRERGPGTLAACLGRPARVSEADRAARLIDAGFVTRSAKGVYTAVADPPPQADGAHLAPASRRKTSPAILSRTVPVGGTKHLPAMKRKAMKVMRRELGLDD
jgi:hypothetical protein